MFHVRADDRTRGDLGQRRRAFYPEARSRHNAVELPARSLGRGAGQHRPMVLLGGPVAVL